MSTYSIKMGFTTYLRKRMADCRSGVRYRALETAFRTALHEHMKDGQGSVYDHLKQFLEEHKSQNGELVGPRTRTQTAGHALGYLIQSIRESRK